MYLSSMVKTSPRKLEFRLHGMYIYDHLWIKHLGRVFLRHVTWDRKKSDSASCLADCPASAGICMLHNVTYVYSNTQRYDMCV